MTHCNWLILVVLIALPARAQESQHDAEQSMAGMEPEPMVQMTMEDPLGLGMSREGSGTTWQPDSTPIYGHHFMAAEWMLMLHYNVLAGYDYQSGARGDRQFTSSNWIMLMAQHSLWDGQFTARAMLSAEPLTTGGKSGFPMLLQTGEAVGGVALHDRQHPHDLFMEMALKYNHALTQDLGFELYLAPSGEPALGPVAFPHRLSASANPFAVLGHHWQDSSHISFGVITAGIYTRQVKLEGSWFNGREPDENRYDFDFRAPDSYSARLSFNPTEALSFQVSYGYLKSPEEIEPDVSVQRITASALYNQRLEKGNWITSAVFGRNMPSSGPSTVAALLETNFEMDHNTVFGRIEYVQRTGNDLILSATDADTVFNASVMEIGYVRDVALGPTVVGLGVAGSLNVVGSGLEPYYGSRFPVGAMFFVRLRPNGTPGGMNHHHH